MRLEAYKKSGVYAVLKRIEMWQSRGGQRLGDIFQGVSECLLLVHGTLVQRFPFLCNPLADRQKTKSLSSPHFRI